MRLLNVHTLQLEDFTRRKVPPYCILSHRWGDDEVSFKELRKGLKQTGSGYRKIVDFCRVVKQRPVYYDTVSRQFVERKRDWVWIDTCCIDKRSSAELSEAINSMYEWYRNASECFVYLSDVTCDPSSRNVLNFPESEWFTRGWTLQELLAPRVLIFFTAGWEVFGHVFRKITESARTNSGIERLYGQSIESNLTTITGISRQYLTKEKPLLHASIAQRMSWASRRKTTREEDEAYSLLGIFGINMPLLYGEGGNAFLRLQQEIIKRSTDESILAWGRLEQEGEDPTSSSLGILADSPRRFGRINTKWEACRIFHRSYAITNNGLEVRAHLVEGMVTSDRGETIRRVLLTLNYSRDKAIHVVTVPLRMVAPNTYERAAPTLHEITFRRRGSNWVEMKEQLIYLRTGLELDVIGRLEQGLELVDVSD